MSIATTATSSLTSEADLTEKHVGSDLPFTYETQRTKSGILLGSGRTAGYIPSEPSKKKPTIWVWRHGDAITRVSAGKKLWLCRICYNKTTEGLITFQADPTTGPRRHLVDNHHYDYSGDFIGKQNVPSKRKNVLRQIEEQNKAQNTSFDHTTFESLFVQ